MITPAIEDDLLHEFRRAADIEPRLLHLESWLERDVPEHDTPAYWRRWTLATRRRLKLMQNNPRLASFSDTLHNYLIQVYEHAAKERGNENQHHGEAAA